jgi:hypothetical protein
MAQSSHPKPDRLLMRDQNRIATKIGVTTKKTIQGSCICRALLSPGKLPGTKYMMMVCTKLQTKQSSRAGPARQDTPRHPQLHQTTQRAIEIYARFLPCLLAKKLRRHSAIPCQMEGSGRVDCKTRAMTRAAVALDVTAPILNTSNCKDESRMKLAACR